MTTKNWTYGDEDGKCNFCNNKSIDNKIAHEERCPAAVGRKFAKNHTINGVIYKTLKEIK